MRKYLLGILVLIVAAIAFSSWINSIRPGRYTPPPPETSSDSSTPPKPAKPTAEQAAAAAKNFNKYESGAVNGTLNVKGLAPIEFQLYPKAAPKTVANFISLCKSGFYNGLLFHRVVPGFVAQTGDPQSRHVKGSDIANISAQEAGQKYGLGQNGSDKTIPFEENDLKNVAGAMAMALSSPKSNTGTSQFFINFTYNNYLDGKYCVFGRVVKGLQTAMSIKQGDRITSITIQ